MDHSNSVFGGMTLAKRHRSMRIGGTKHGLGCRHALPSVGILAQGPRRPTAIRHASFPLS